MGFLNLNQGNPNTCLLTKHGAVYAQTLLFYIIPSCIYFRCWKREAQLLCRLTWTWWSWKPKEKLKEYLQGLLVCHCHTAHCDAKMTLQSDIEKHQISSSLLFPKLEKHSVDFYRDFVSKSHTCFEYSCDRSSVFRNLILYKSLFQNGFWQWLIKPFFL